MQMSVGCLLAGLAVYLLEKACIRLALYLHTRSRQAALLSHLFEIIMIIDIITVALIIIISRTGSSGSSRFGARGKPVTSRMLLPQSRAIIINGFVTNL